MMCLRPNLVKDRTGTYLDKYVVLHAIWPPSRQMVGADRVSAAALSTSSRTGHEWSASGLCQAYGAEERSVEAAGYSHVKRLDSAEQCRDSREATSCFSCPMGLPNFGQYLFTCNPELQSPSTPFYRFTTIHAHQTPLKASRFPIVTMAQSLQ